MNPCCAVILAFTSCHHFTNSSSLPFGTENTLIKVTAIMHLPSSHLTQCVPVPVSSYDSNSELAYRTGCFIVLGLQQAEHPVDALTRLFLSPLRASRLGFDFRQFAQHIIPGLNQVQHHGGRLGVPFELLDQPVHPADDLFNLRAEAFGIARKAFNLQFLSGQRKISTSHADCRASEP